MTPAEKELLLDCIAHVTFACQSYCVGQCGCSQMREDAEAVVEKLDKL